MRIAILSDIHGNRTAFEAVLSDLRHTAPDLIFQGGDLPHGGAHPSEIVDHIRDLGWPGVAGNTDDLMWCPDALTGFAQQSPHLKSMFDTIEEMAAWTRETLGEARIAWLRALPRQHIHAPLALVHASPESTWRGPALTATDAELESTFAPLGQPIAIYGHIHHPYIRNTPAITVINTGSVGLPYDGDPRASYLLLDDATSTIRRVEYDLAQELQALKSSSLPHAAWIARSLESARPQMP